MKKRLLLVIFSLLILFVLIYGSISISIGLYVKKTVISNLGQREHHYSENSMTNTILTYQLDYIARGVPIETDSILYDFNMSFPMVWHDFKHASANYHYTIKIYSTDTEGDQKLIRGAIDIPVIVELLLSKGSWQITNVIESP